jgi:ribosomal-protein-alanine N-acetyltransferase
MIKFKPALRLKNRSYSLTGPANNDERVVLKGKRVLLIPPRLDDYAQWKKVRAANRDFLTPYEPRWASDSLSKNFFLRRLKRQTEEVAHSRGAFFYIHHQQSGKIIGGININDIRMGAQRCGTLGYWLDQGHQGQGYMREAAGLVIGHAFYTLKLRRLNAACLKGNESSVKLLAALGFEEEGYAKKYLQINGKWQDHRLFGLCSNYSEMRTPQ